MKMFTKFFLIFTIVTVDRSVIGDPSKILTSSEISSSSTSLDLSGKGFTTIDEHAFDNSTDLISLNLGHNKISKLSPSIFAKLKNLQSLSLNDNLLRTTENAFHKLQNVKFIDLSNNPMIGELGSNYFAGLSNSVCVATKNISNLLLVSGDVFGGKLEDRRNIYKPFGEKSVSPFTIAWLQYCIKNGELYNMEYIIDEPSSGCKKQYLSGTNESAELMMNDRKIHSIVNDAFVNITNIKILHLSWNRFNDTRFVKNLPPSLIQLLLGGNRIQLLKSDAFLKLKNLQHVSLPYNKMEFIEPGAFGNSKFREIYLNENKLRFVDRGVFTGLESLKILGLTHNELTIIDADAFDIPHLEELGLTGNRIETIDPKVFKNLPELRSLGIAKNRIKILEFGVFPGSLRTSISRIYVGGTNIEFITAGTAAMCNRTAL